MNQSVRAAAVQFSVRSHTLSSLVDHMGGFCREASGWNTNIIVFPEYIIGTLANRSLNQAPQDQLIQLIEFGDEYQSCLKALAKKYNLWVLGGTFIERDGNTGKCFNSAPLVTPDGRIYIQRKIHLTPWEKSFGFLSAGDQVLVIDSPFGKLSTAICYDIEFPDIISKAAALGCQIVLNPSCTDTLAGYYRVRRCAQARAIENQLYVVNAPTVGWYPEVEWLTSNHGRASVVSPCDLGLPANGMIAQATLDAPDQLIVGDLNLATLNSLKVQGSVTPSLDRRTDFLAKLV
ncbi:MAG: acyltransferase [Proteobacteria bacterium]|nr:acyltransferase [Pseudomonadota bacterium]